MSDLKKASYEVIKAVRGLISCKPDKTDDHVQKIVNRFVEYQSQGGKKPLEAFYKISESR